MGGGGKTYLAPPIFLNGGGVRYPPPPCSDAPIYIYIYIYIEIRYNKLVTFIINIIYMYVDAILL